MSALDGLCLKIKNIWLFAKPITTIIRGGTVELKMLYKLGSDNLVLDHIHPNGLAIAIDRLTRLSTETLTSVTIQGKTTTEAIQLMVQRCPQIKSLSLEDLTLESFGRIVEIRGL